MELDPGVKPRSRRYPSQMPDVSDRLASPTFTRHTTDVESWMVTPAVLPLGGRGTGQGQGRWRMKDARWLDG